MATTVSPSTADESEPCAVCASKYNRARPSLCQCKHCSIPLCFECMKQHNDELLQNVEQFSHQYNELRQLIQSKQNMIDEEPAKYVANINQYFDSYIDQLRATQKKTLEEVEIAKQRAREFIQQVDTDLLSTGESIEGLVKDGAVQMVKMKKVASDLKKVEEQLTKFQMTKTENPIATQPNFSVGFDYPTVEIKAADLTDTKVKPKRQTELQQLPLETNVSNMARQSSVISKHPLSQPKSNDIFEDEDDLTSNGNDNNDTHLKYTRIRTTYNVERMASDGENILYSSYKNEGSDIIAYCIIDADNDDADAYRDWKQSRIEDMIWWNSIRKFVCATNKGIYTVDHTQRRFKIYNVINGDWSYLRVAANTHELFVWMDIGENGFNGIEIFSASFDFIRAIDFNATLMDSFVDNSVSFCATDKLVASICTRQQRNREVFKVIFCDLGMNKLNSIPLGSCDGSIEIRTDGNDHFFITTGTRRFYIIHSINTRTMIELDQDAQTIAILKNQRVAVSNEHGDIEILTY